MRISLCKFLALSRLLGHAVAAPATNDAQLNTPSLARRADDDLKFALEYKATVPGTGAGVKPGTTLRVLCLGDSITVGLGSHWGNGYREQLRRDLRLSGDYVEFAGTVRNGTMEDGYYAAWSGKTITYIADNSGPSLKQRPNIVLLHAGTNDMNPDPSVSYEGSDPGAAAERLGKLMDQIFVACPDAVVLVAMIIDSCLEHQDKNVDKYQALIPQVVNKRKAAGKHTMAVNFTPFPTTLLLPDCLHPSEEGYLTLGHYWYDFMTQIPKEWIKSPVGSSPARGPEREPQLESENAANRAGLGDIIESLKWLVVMAIAQVLIK